MERNNYSTGIMTGCLIAVLIILFNSFTEPKPPAPDTKTWVSNDAKHIKSQIDAYSKLGYKVQSITPQSVSTSIHKYYDYNYRDLKGDIILVMVK